jgi:valyl-tRNA synthetase
MPFLTEDIWHRLKINKEESLVKFAWPEIEENLISEKATLDMEFVKSVIGNIRTIRSEMNVPPAKKAEIKIKTPDSLKKKLILENQGYLQQLARISGIEFVDMDKTFINTAMAVVGNTEIFLPLEGLIDVEKEKQRLTKEVQRLENQIVGLNKKLNNSQFLNKAPQNVVNQEKEKLTNFKNKLDKIYNNLKQLN